MDMDKVYIAIVLMLITFINFATAIMIQINHIRRRLNDIEFKLMKKDVIENE